MGYLPPPQDVHGAQASYSEAYSRILTTFRSSPLTSASSIILLVAPDADALCAARMLSDLFNQDDVIHRTIPVSGFMDLERIRDELVTYEELHTLILLNIGGVLELLNDEWFGGFDGVTVHVIDSLRPLNLDNIFNESEQAKRIVVWDDGGITRLQEEKKSWEVVEYEPNPEDDDDDDEEELGSDVEESEHSDTDNNDEYEEDGFTSGKRRSLGDGDSKPTKRRRINRERIHRMSGEEYAQHKNRLNKYYAMGTHHGQSAAGTIYLLATALERVDNDLLWFAILGLTYQYINSRISREDYDRYHSVYIDEVSRLNVAPPGGSSLISLNPDDTSVRATDELRFMLFRHWTLYDAMYHSSYVASKLGIWKERGRKRLIGLLAKMGFSISQTEQPYPHMDMDLKKVLLQKLNDVAPEYGLVELSYPSFMRCNGYRSQPLSAADAVEGIGTLLDIAGGVRMEVEVEGARNGGEWFGGGRVWEGRPGREVVRRRREDEREKRASGVEGLLDAGGNIKSAEEEEDGGAESKRIAQWWVKNFWSAFDALDDISQLREALNLSMSLHRAIIRQGTSIIDKQDIRTLRNHRVVVLSQGPDLALFAHPSVLSRLALWLVDALRDHLPSGGIGTRSKRKTLPFVVACLNETTATYMVVGLMAALDFGDVRKNEFGRKFIAAKERCNTVTRYASLDANVIEVEQKDLKMFLEALCEALD